MTLGAGTQGRKRKEILEVTSLKLTSKNRAINVHVVENISITLFFIRGVRIALVEKLKYGKGNKDFKKAIHNPTAQK